MSVGISSFSSICSSCSFILVIDLMCRYTRVPLYSFIAIPGAREEEVLEIFAFFTVIVLVWEVIGSASSKALPKPSK